MRDRLGQVVTGCLSNGAERARGRQRKAGLLLREPTGQLSTCWLQTPESRSEEVASGREAVDEQAQKDAWGPRGREPALQSAPVSSASVLAQAPSKQRPGVRQARLLWKLV